MKRITIRLTDELHETIVRKSKANNLNISDYFRNFIKLDLGDDIKETIELKKDIYFLYKNLSNNINQIAKKINSEKSKKQLEEISEAVEEIWQSLNA